VNKNRRHVLLPAALAAGSFLFLFLLMSLTSPVRNVAYGAVFFLGLMILLMSLGYLTLRLNGREVHAKNRYRIFTISIFIVVLVMFRSAQSLSLVDGLVLLFITAGMLFYISRRAY